MQQPDPLRLIILCKGNQLEAWEFKCLQEVLELEYVHLVLIVEDASNREGTRLLKPLQYPWRKLLWRAYKRLRLNKLPALQETDASHLFEGIPRLRCITELKGRYSEFFAEDDVERIKSYKPDIILRFGFNIIRGAILDVARYGVWSYHHGDIHAFRGGPPGFWEIVRKSSVTGAVLQRLTNQLDNGIVLRSGYFPTIRKSYRANLDQLLWGSVLWVKQACIDIYHKEISILNAQPASSTAVLTTYPNNGVMIWSCLQRLVAGFQFHFNELFRHDQWNIGILPQSIADILENGITRTIAWYPAPVSQEFYADPFGRTDYKGDEIVLCEHYSYKAGKGVIAKIKRNGQTEEWLERDHHLSYPFLFEIDGELMLLPEAHENYNVSLRDALHPQKTVITLLHGIPAVDSTVFEYNNKWWLFCTREDDASNVCLYIYYADHKDSAFEPHVNNPIKVDVRSSRPAGTPFLHQGKLYRPAQDCSENYGSSIVLNEITMLTPTGFKEHEVRRLTPLPDWEYNKGMHTLSQFGTESILIDAKRYRFSSSQFKRVLRRKFRRFFAR